MADLNEQLLNVGEHEQLSGHQYNYYTVMSGKSEVFNQWHKLGINAKDFIDAIDWLDGNPARAIGIRKIGGGVYDKGIYELVYLQARDSNGKWYPKGHKYDYHAYPYHGLTIDGYTSIYKLSDRCNFYEFDGYTHGMVSVIY